MLSTICEKKYGSFAAIKEEDDRLATLSIPERVTEAIRSTWAVGPKALGGILKTIGAAQYGFGKLQGEVTPIKNPYEKIQDTPFYALGDAYDWMGDWGKNEVAHNAWESKVADTIGQVAIQAGAAWATGGMSLPATIGLTQGFSSVVDDAAKEGATPNQQLALGAIGAVAAMPDILLMKGWFKSFTGPARVGLVRKLGQSVFAKLLPTLGEAEASLAAKGAMQGFIARSKQLGQRILFPESEMATALTLGSSAKTLGKGSFLEGGQEWSENDVNLIGKKLIFKPEITWSDILSVSDQDIESIKYGAIGGLFGSGIEVASHPDAFKTIKEKQAAFAALNESFADTALVKKDGKFTLGGQTFELTEDVAAAVSQYEEAQKSVERISKDLVKGLNRAKKAKSFTFRKEQLQNVKDLRSALVELTAERDMFASDIVSISGAGDALNNVVKAVVSNDSQTYGQTPTETSAIPPQSAQVDPEALVQDQPTPVQPADVPVSPQEPKLETSNDGQNQAQPESSATRVNSFEVEQYQPKAADIEAADSAVKQASEEFPARRITKPKRSALNAVIDHGPAQKIADILDGEHSLTLEDLAKTTKLTFAKAEDAVRLLYEAGKVEIRPDNKIKLVEGITAHKKPLYEQFDESGVVQGEEAILEAKQTSRQDLPVERRAAPSKTPTFSDEQKSESRAVGLSTDGVSPEQLRRDKGSFTKDGVTYQRQPAISPALPKGSIGKVKFSDDVTPEFTYRVVPAATLQPAHINGVPNLGHFLPEAQPKTRTDQASVKAADKIASQINFAEVSESPSAYAGAPVINSRGEVVQGNNRAAGIKLHLADAGSTYKEELAKNAEKYGLTAEQVNAVEDPVLVREINVDDAKAIELGNFDELDITSGGKRRLDATKTASRIPHKEKAKIVDDIFRDVDEDASLKDTIRNSSKSLQLFFIEVFD